jgi:hypothetical protein
MMDIYYSTSTNALCLCYERVKCKYSNQLTFKYLKKVLDPEKIHWDKVLTLELIGTELDCTNKKNVLKAQDTARFKLRPRVYLWIRYQDEDDNTSL